VTVGSDTTTDDSNGNLLPSGCHRWRHGELRHRRIHHHWCQATAAYDITYAFNAEGNLNIMDYEMKLSSTPVTAKVMKLKTLWSEEADQNLQAMYNIKAESVLLNALTNALTYQKHRQVIFDLRARADAGFVVWDAIAPPSVNYQTHKFSIIDAFETASNFIFGATNMVAGNWLLLGLQAATVVATLPQFVAGTTARRCRASPTSATSATRRCSPIRTIRRTSGWLATRATSSSRPGTCSRNIRSSTPRPTWCCRTSSTNAVLRPRSPGR
jgi:hypothetical protein